MSVNPLPLFVIQREQKYIQLVLSKNFSNNVLQGVWRSCLPVYLPACLSACPTCLPACLSACLTVCLSYLPALPHGEGGAGGQQQGAWVQGGRPDHLTRPVI